MQDRKSEKMFSNDHVFNNINKMFVSLQDQDVKRNNAYLQQTICSFTERIAKIEPRIIVCRIVFVGSYYKGTKVGRPEEFDLNLILNLPLKRQDTKFVGDIAGYIKIHSGFQRSDIDTPEYKKVQHILDENMYIDKDKFHHWMEGIVNKVLIELSAKDDKNHLDVGQNGIKLKKSGPAFTLGVTLSDGTNINIDLVPVLEFDNPPCEQQQMLKRFSKKNWYAIPKLLQDETINNSHLYWRLSFYEQEKEIYKSRGFLKPIIRQMKKLRDTQDWKRLASYYIETVFLNQIPTLDTLRNESNTYLFFFMLQELHKVFVSRNLPYYWDKQLNLLSKMKYDHLHNLECRLQRIILQITKSMSGDPFAMARFVLNKNELESLQNEISDIPEKSVQKVAQTCNAQPAQQIRSNMNSDQSLVEDISIGMNNLQRIMETGFLETSRMIENMMKRLEVVETKVDTLIADKETDKEYIVIRQRSKL